MTNVFFSFFFLAADALKKLMQKPFRWQRWWMELSFVAVESAPLVLICVVFAAIVTIIEASYHMKLVIQNDSMVPGFASLLIIRELGSVVSALLIGSRVGAGWAAEVSSMKVSEQIDALKLLSIDKVQYLVVPKVFGSVIGTVLLGLVANIACVYFAMLVTIMKLGYSSGSFLSVLRLFVEPRDLLFAGIKLACFGFVIPIISCQCGFRAQSGAEGVGQSTTKAVVGISISIIFLDFILSFLFTLF